MKWIDATKCDPKDDHASLVGYDIPCNRHFYQYQPPRDLTANDAARADIMKLL